ncbi:hypothetical protein [Clostridium simiarum]|uniref:hypothetical protein n=1 Tax=Clostridium simiarum TaxID=2841506 RepID=UPI001FE6585F|nr:hypothetical protein [Clostridium simiarum]
MKSVNNFMSYVQFAKDFLMKHKPIKKRKHEEYTLKQNEDLKKHLRLIDGKLDYYHDACQTYDMDSPIPTC